MQKIVSFFSVFILLWPIAANELDAYLPQMGADIPDWAEIRTGSSSDSLSAHFRNEEQQARNKGDLKTANKYLIDLANQEFVLGHYVASSHAVQQIIDSLEKGGKDYIRQDSARLSLYTSAMILLAKNKIYLSSRDEALYIVQDLMQTAGEDSTSLITAVCYNAIGIIFSTEQHMQTARDYFLKALRIYQHHNDLNGISHVYGNLGYNATFLNDKEKALGYFLESYNALLKSGKKGESLAYIPFQLAVAYEQLDNIKLAERYYEEAMASAEENAYLHLLYYIANNYTSFLIRQEKEDAALRITEKVLDQYGDTNGDNLYMQSILFQKRGSILLKNGRYREAAEALEKGYELLRISDRTNRREKLDQLQVQFDQYKIQQENIIKAQKYDLAQKAIVQRNLWIAFCAVLILSLVFALSLLARRIYKQCKINNLMNDRLHLTQEGYRNSLENIKGKFGKELDQKNKKIASDALYFLKIQSIMDELSGRIKTLKMFHHLTGKEELLLREMERLLAEIPPDKNWNEFELYFQQVDQTFFKKIETLYPGLTPNEKRLCALIYLNLNTKEIASLTNRSFGSVNVAKNRLKKKMHLDPEEDLYEKLSGL